MESVLFPTLFWIFVLSILMPFGMKESDNKDMIKYTSKKDLEENFIAHWKNPEKYAAFKFNDETFPYASGFYVLRPYYQKLKICTEEKDDYDIEYSSFDKKWNLIRNPNYNPIVETLDLKDNTIATLLEGEEFSYMYNNEEDILAFKTFEDVISKNKRAGIEIKKLKTEIEKLKSEIESLKITNDDLKTTDDSLIKNNDDLNNRLIRGKEMFKKIKKDNQLMEEEKKLAFLKRSETLNENENLRQELETQKFLMQKQNKEIQELRSQNGGLSYDLSEMKETKKEIESLKKDMDPLKNENKKLNQENKRLRNNEIKISPNQYQPKKEHDTQNLNAMNSFIDLLPSQDQYQPKKEHDTLFQNQINSLMGMLPAESQKRVKEMSESPPGQIRHMINKKSKKKSKIDEMLAFDARNTTKKLLDMKLQENVLDLEENYAKINQSFDHDTELNE